MGPLPSSLTLEVRCQNLPATFDGVPVYLGIQEGNDVVGIVPGSVGKTVLRPEFRLADAAGSPNFLGRFAQGSREERFFYLCWGLGATSATFGRFRRLKVHLAHLTWPQIAAVALRKKPLRVTLDLTDAKGGPLCASVRPGHPNVAWDLP
ncbi:MAG: DUF5990 family protein [Verrucomicrobia bacterium]|nr:DUF5990 family protein [Verrucomicrobiota bacterium]